jgi:hypothetical protein
VVERRTRRNPMNEMIAQMSMIVRNKLTNAAMIRTLLAGSQVIPPTEVGKRHIQTISFLKKELIMRMVLEISARTSSAMRVVVNNMTFVNIFDKDTSESFHKL